MIKQYERIFAAIQQNIIDEFCSFETKNSCLISDDSWKRKEGGGGRTFVIESGKFFDKAAINFSSISGKKLPNSALERISKNKTFTYRAMGVSIITHPKNPFVPTSHMNIRLFLLLNSKREIMDWWVGGGYDLTPYFVYEKDCKYWHKSAKTTLDSFNKGFYKKFAKNCDEYFYLPHRNEKRGIGGIFFDNFTELPIDESVNMLKCVAETYLNSYLEIMNSRKNRSFSPSNKSFQEYRRGRYAEFNLIYDRGTSFGLQSKGRIESILASLPPKTSWIYKKDTKFKKYEENLLAATSKQWRG
jgi:coproporphyrinogen III oxidase